MNVNSLSSTTGLQQYLSTSPISAARGIDADGDSSGNGNGNSQGTNSQSSASPAAYTVQISGAGKAKHARHHSQGTFNAQSFVKKLDTSGLTVDQQKTLQTILSKYNGSQMNGDKMSQLVSDIKNAGMDTQKLFNNIQIPEIQQAGNTQNLNASKAPTFSAIA